MRRKVVYLGASVQILIGLLLLCGAVFVQTVILPQIKGKVCEIGDKVSEAAEALRAADAAYCQSATNLFSAAENLVQTSSALGSIGWNLKETGRGLHFKVAVLNQINGLGDNICEIGSGVVNIACAIRAQGNIVKDYKNGVHVRVSGLLLDYAATLDDVARMLKDSRAVSVYDWFVCAVGVLVSLLFITNGLILISIAGLHGRSR